MPHSSVMKDTPTAKRTVGDSVWETELGVEKRAGVKVLDGLVFLMMFTDMASWVGDRKVTFTRYKYLLLLDNVTFHEHVNV